jgi:hypothetical protein
MFFMVPVLKHLVIKIQKQGLHKVLNNKESGALKSHLRQNPTNLLKELGHEINIF